MCGVFRVAAEDVREWPFQSSLDPAIPGGVVVEPMPAVRNVSTLIGEVTLLEGKSVTINYYVTRMSEGYGQCVAVGRYIRAC